MAEPFHVACVTVSKLGSRRRRAHPPLDAIADLGMHEP